jgi:flagellar biosynthesis protein FlhB
MAKTKVIKFNDFMSSDYKAKEKEQRKEKFKKIGKVAAAATVPIATGGAIGTLSLLMAASRPAFASTGSTLAIEASTKEWMGEQTISALAHVLDPVVDILVALSFPIASVIIVGACFMFMFNNAEKAWSMIQNAGLGYVLIQVSPLILDVLKQVGNAV